MEYNTQYVKNIYEKDSIVSYFNHITFELGLLASEKLVFKNYVDIDSKILDVGCGAGRTTIGLKQCGYKDITGIDISKKMIEKAQRNDPTIRFIVGDVIKLPFKKEFFEVVLFSFNGLMLLPGLENRVRAMKEIFRVLKRDGLFIFSTPFLDNKLDKKYWKRKFDGVDFEKYDVELGDIFLDDMGVNDIYMHMPFVKEVTDMIRDTGFSLIEFKRRMEIQLEPDKVEAELDDNMYWIVRRL